MGTVFFINFPDNSGWIDDPAHDQIVVSTLYFTSRSVFAETSDTRIKQFMSLVPLKKGMIAADLGSGDGRILIKLAQKANLTAVGYEIDPKLVKLSRAKIAEAGLSSRITIKQQSFWRAELGNFDLVTVYGVQEMMPRLEKKLLKELKKGASIVSVYFKFPSWMEKKRLGDIRLYQK